ncbi:phospho-N-acetylmuramoyl-pentapeptide-transferase [Nautilia profundicola AmH]|uniref:Phospho-N-acetylmuramoyl-pentapeptide-transferase n=1 Tax=Nautilia profundicola (strain ATCC BAA-1463 / DSM 18972 / AmH) TaxID=598659 RepID=MRAY_NAUPA|nr:phospho-N-acetylmuramoyl-pentapeptide-transferase [Nautilia profundicola]B9L7V6.1 RecName: Full=Phospho-N-acetylmuramoyl-pentapeptide-transferase; AltName: Full=UDP-MurNAc-pentapeptide phosphotransferase [Nautilia profundicola AmH]ACM92857.1 phospho-N-acetylmuramoyl-pentapeptide-transferase [Nautilia profundicola AmH]
MLYYLYEHFHINIFHYITFRAILAFFLSFFITIFIMPKFISWAKAKATQPIFELAPDNHKTKNSTPTMGGLIYITSAVISILITTEFNKYVLLTLLLLVYFTYLGFIDDYGKIKGSSNKAGLSAKTKFLLQWVGALVISYLLIKVGFDTKLYVPFYKYPIFDMGYYAVIFWAFIIVAMSNAVNLTDGLDGLATVPSIFSLFTLGILLYIVGNYKFSSYLFYPFELGVGELTIIVFALIGALLGFLWYNANPAEVFMGDSGSLPLGAVIGFLAIVAKSELLLIFIAFVFIMETVSVILQVGSYKTRGKRVFKMAPIHHHFEMLGWKENKITIRFWIMALITNLIAILSIKIR